MKGGRCVCVGGGQGVNSFLFLKGGLFDRGG